MGIVTCKLEEQMSDMRSNQVAFKFQIDNGGSVPITLLNALPRLPEEALLIEVKDRSNAASTAKRIDLLEDLTKMLNMQLWLRSEDLRKDMVAKQKAMVSELLTVTGYLKVVFQLLFSHNKYESQINRNFSCTKYEITSIEDAHAAVTRWIDNAESKNVLTEIFIEKVEQLVRVDSIVNDSEKRALSVIESGSFYAATYILKFPRSLVDPRKYQFTVEAAYELAGELGRDKHSTQTQLISSTASILISPYPAALSLITIVGSILGSAIQLSLMASNHDFYETVFATTKSGKIIIAPVIAFIFFNIYEHTSLGKNLNVGVSWRSALLIGALCGLSQDRVLSALQAFLAVSA